MFNSRTEWITELKNRIKHANPNVWSRILADCTHEEQMFIESNQLQDLPVYLDTEDDRLCYVTFCPTNHDRFPILMLVGITVEDGDVSGSRSTRIPPNSVPNGLRLNLTLLNEMMSALEFTGVYLKDVP